MAVAISYLPLSAQYDDWPDWAPKRLSSLWIHRRKAVSEIPIPESGRSSLSARCPQRPDDVFMGNGRLLILNLPVEF